MQPFVSLRIFPLKFILDRETGVLSYNHERKCSARMYWVIQNPEIEIIVLACGLSINEMGMLYDHRCKNNAVVGTIKSFQKYVPFLLPQAMN